MTALTSMPPGGRAATRDDTARSETLEGAARHVSAHGCQFVLNGRAPAVGCRLAFATPAGAAVSGTIRWVLRDRIGFAFDRPIDADAIAGLPREATVLRAVGLLPEGSAGPAPARPRGPAPTS